MDFEQYRAQPGFFGLLRSVEAGLRNCDPQLLGHGSDRFREGDVLDFLDEGEDVSGDATAEAVEELAGSVDRERGRFLAVEGTESGIVLRAGFLQLDVVADDADDIRLLLDDVREVAGVSHRALRIVSHDGLGLNIAEANCCGEAVEGADTGRFRFGYQQRRLRINKSRVETKGGSPAKCKIGLSKRSVGERDGR